MLLLVATVFSIYGSFKSWILSEISFGVYLASDFDFFTFVIGLAGNFCLYLFACFMNGKPSVIFFIVPYLIFTPFMTNYVTIHAMANIHDFSWGNRGADVAEHSKNALVFRDYCFFPFLILNFGLSAFFVFGSNGMVQMALYCVLWYSFTFSVVRLFLAIIAKILYPFRYHKKPVIVEVNICRQL